MHTITTTDYDGDPKAKHVWVCMYCVVAMLHLNCGANEPRMPKIHR